MDGGFHQCQRLGRGDRARVAFRNVSRDMSRNVTSGTQVGDRARRIFTEKSSTARYVVKYIVLAYRMYSQNKESVRKKGPIGALELYASTYHPAPLNLMTSHRGSIPMNIIRTSSRAAKRKSTYTNLEVLCRFLPGDLLYARCDASVQDHKSPGSTVSFGTNTAIRGNLKSPPKF